MKRSCDIWVKGCPCCHNIFVVSANNSKQKYCSSKCWMMVRATQIMGVNNPCYGRKHTKEERLKMSERHWDCRGSNNPLYGVGHTDKAREKMRQSALARSPMEEQTKQKISRGLKRTWEIRGHPSVGLSPSLETRRKLSEALKGAKCYLWNGGTSKEPYPFYFDDDLKKAIRARDGYQCQLCGGEQNGQTLSVHHVDYDKHNINPNNLISLCRVCHTKTNHHREYYREYFANIIRGNKLNANLFLRLDFSVS